jgi:hypothetical protein
MAITNCASKPSRPAAKAFSELLDRNACRIAIDEKQLKLSDKFGDRSRSELSLAQKPKTRVSRKLSFVPLWVLKSKKERRNELQKAHLSA